MSRYDERPAHDKSSHYADAGRYMAEVIDKKLYVMDERVGSRQEYAELECSI